MTIKELKEEATKAAEVELCKIKHGRRYGIKEDNLDYNGFCDITLDGFPENWECDDWDLMDEEDYSFFDTHSDVDFENWFGDKDAKILLVVMPFNFNIKRFLQMNDIERRIASHRDKPCTVKIVDKVDLHEAVMYVVNINDDEWTSVIAYPDGTFIYELESHVEYTEIFEEIEDYDWETEDGCSTIMRNGLPIACTSLK